MRCSVSSPDETLRRELKIHVKCAAEYFWRTLRCFIWWWNTVSNAWYYFSNKIILEEKLGIPKWAVFHLISKQSLNINFLCIFFINYLWVWQIFFRTLTSTEVHRVLTILFLFLLNYPAGPSMEERGAMPLLGVIGLTVASYADVLRGLPRVPAPVTSA